MYALLLAHENPDLSAVVYTDFYGKEGSTGNRGLYPNIHDAADAMTDFERGNPNSQYIIVPASMVASQSWGIDPEWDIDIDTINAHWGDQQNDDWDYVMREFGD